MEYSNTLKNTAIGHNSDLAPLPCLNSNISIQTTHTNTPPNPPEAQGRQALAPLARLTTQHRKTAFILTQSVYKLAKIYGLHNLGFLTLTFAEHILDPAEAQRRLNSLLTNVIKPRYSDYLGVFERQKSGRIHYHLLVALHLDIRTGVDFTQFAQGDYSSGGKPLRSEWAYWRKTAPIFGFGRTELLPIRSTAEGIGKYVGKYISKHCEVRKQEDKGVRLVRYSNGARAGTTRFQFQSAGSQEWRRKLAIFAHLVQEQHPEVRVSTLSDLTAVLGKRWAYTHREYILQIP